MFVFLILEDLDFYCVDNMPVVLMPIFAELCMATKGRYDKVALDVIAGTYGNDQYRVNALRAAGYDAALVQEMVNNTLK